MQSRLLLLPLVFGISTNITAQVFPGAPAGPRPGNAPSPTAAPSSGPQSAPTTKAKVESLSDQPATVDSDFYNGYLNNRDGSRFKAVIERASKEADPVAYLKDFSAKYNQAMEAKFAEMGIKFNFVNDAVGLDKSLFYMDLYYKAASKRNPTSSHSGDLASIIQMIDKDNRKSKMDMSGLPEFQITIPAATQEAFKKYAHGALDAAFSAANANSPWSKFDTKDETFELPIAKAGQKEHDYEEVKVQSSYEIKEGKVIVTLKLSKTVRNLSINLNDMEVWDYNKTKRTADGGFALEKTLTYEIAEGSETDKFKKMITAGSFKLKDSEWTIGEDGSKISFTVPSVKSSFDTSKPYLVITADQKALPAASPSAYDGATLKGAKYIGVPATTNDYIEFMKRLIDLKKNKAFGMALPANDEILRDLKLDLVPRSCHA